jgi:hypothetical protein
MRRNHTCHNNWIQLQQGDKSRESDISSIPAFEVREKDDDLQFWTSLKDNLAEIRLQSRLKPTAGTYTSSFGLQVI